VRGVRARAACELAHAHRSAVCAVNAAILLVLHDAVADGYETDPFLQGSAGKMRTRRGGAPKSSGCRSTTTPTPGPITSLRRRATARGRRDARSKGAAQAPAGTAAG